MYIYKPVDTFQIWNWQCDSSFQVNKPVNCLSWCKARNHPMSLVVGTDIDVQIWELSESHVWEQRNILQDGNSVVRSVAWSSNIGKDYETICRDTERDNFMSADEALEYGLIDKVYRNRADIK